MCTYFSDVAGYDAEITPNENSPFRSEVLKVREKNGNARVFANLIPGRFEDQRCATFRTGAPDPPNHICRPERTARKLSKTKIFLEIYHKRLGFFH